MKNNTANGSGIQRISDHPRQSAEFLWFWPKSRIKRWLIIFGIWTVVALISAFNWYYWRDLGNMDNPWSWYMLIVAKLSVWYVWAVLTFFILWLGRRVTLDRLGWRRWFAAHLGLSIGCVGAYMIVYDIVIVALLGYPLSLEAFGNFVGALFHQHLSYFFLAYWAIIGVDYAIGYYKKFRERELRAAQLERRLAEAQLESLKAQLQPHFLFNTLNMISAYMHSDVYAAERMLIKLSDMLRLSLRQMQGQRITLKKEMELIRLYLEIQQARFKDRLEIKIDIDPALLDALVPCLILQPLVENSIRHGVAPHSKRALVQISASRENGTLMLRVADTGPGLPPDWTDNSETGIGLSNTRERLKQLYGHRQSFVLRSREAHGVEAIICVPYSESSDEN